MIVLMLALLPLFLVSAQTDYVPISPISDEAIDLDRPEGYFARVFTIFISIISILAVIRLMLCGFQYMTSEAISSKEDAKKCIWAIVGGLFLILLSWLILQTINKDITTYQFFERIRGIKTDIIENKSTDPGSPPNPSPGGIQSGGSQNPDPGIAF